MQSTEFSIEYVSPAMIRNDSNDFCLIYKEAGADVYFKREAYFYVKEQTGENGRLTYKALLPDEFKGVTTIPWFSEWKSLVVRRMRDYILGDQRLLSLYGEISVEGLNP